MVYLFQNLVETGSTIKTGRIPKSLMSRNKFKILMVMNSGNPKEKSGKIIIDDEKDIKGLEEENRAEINDPEINQEDKRISKEDLFNDHGG